MKVVVGEGEQFSRDLPGWLCCTGCVLSGSAPHQWILRPVLHSVAVFHDVPSTSDLIKGGRGLCLFLASFFFSRKEKLAVEVIV